MLEQFGNIMEVVKKIQQSVDSTQEQLKKECIEVASGDAIKVVVNGDQSVIEIQLNPKYLTADNAALLQDLLTVTINNALAKSRDLYQTTMNSLAGDLNLPKIPGLF